MIRTVLFAALGVIGARMAYEALDELLDLDQRARDLARGMTGSNVVEREVTF